jgi:hypothetical protein
MSRSSILRDAAQTELKLLKEKRQRQTEDKLVADSLIEDDGGESLLAREDIGDDKEEEEEPVMEDQLEGLFQDDPVEPQPEPADLPEQPYVAPATKKTKSKKTK